MGKGGHRGTGAGISKGDKDHNGEIDHEPAHGRTQRPVSEKGKPKGKGKTMKGNKGKFP